MIPTSGTTGRSKLVMQTHLAYVMAGEGFPYWMQLTADDRLMTSLPLFHINAPAYSTLGSLAARASLVLLPGFSASTFLDDARALRRDGVQQHRRHARDPRAPARRDPTTPTIRSAAATPARRPTASTSSRSRARFGFEIVCGYALSESPVRAHLAPRPAPVRDARLGAPAPDARARQRRARGRRRRDRSVAGEAGELELRNPVIMRGYYEMPEETAAVIVDGWLRTGDLVRVNDDDDLHVPRSQEGSDPAAGREPVAGRGRGRARTASRRRRSGGDRRPVGPVRGGREGLRRAPRPAATPDLAALHAFARQPARRVQGAALHRGGRRAARTRRPTGWPSTGCPTERTPAEMDFEAPRGQSRDR